MNDIVLTSLYFITTVLAGVALVGPRKTYRLAYLPWLMASSAVRAISKVLHWYGDSRHETQVLRLSSGIEDVAVPLMMCWAVIAVLDGLFRAGVCPGRWR